MRKFLLDMRKDFLIMSNFYLVEILSEPNSLTIVTSKKNTQNEQLCAHFVYFFPHNENQEFAVHLRQKCFKRLFKVSKLSQFRMQGWNGVSTGLC